MRLSLFGLILVTLMARPAQAWNSLGHQTVAELAWRQMDPEERRATSDLLKQHPHYKLLLARNVPTGVDTNEWAFLMASVWPDRVRPAKPGKAPKPLSVTQYNAHPHGIDLPFLRPGDSNGILLATYSVRKPNAQTVLTECIASLKSPTASPQDRAVSLCWVLHLCGDLHQPLHAATLVTKDKPKGSGLGGAFIVLNPRGRQVDLHSFWDQLPGTDLSYKGIIALADALAANPELKPARLEEYRQNTTVASWVEESHQCAVTFAYAEERIQWVDASGVTSRQIPVSAIPLMKAEYARDARKIAERRLALAAQRLADILKEIW
jgi:hypothetical protein